MRTPTPKLIAALVAAGMLAGCVTTGTTPAPATRPEPVSLFALDFEHLPAPPADLSADVRRAWEAMRGGDAAGARVALDAMTSTGADASTAEGMWQLSQGATGQARAHFQNALTAQPEYPTALYGLGFVAESDGDRDSGLDWYQRAVDADLTLSAAAVRLQVLRLEEAQALIAQGERAEAAGDSRGALSAYQSANELAPDVLEPYLRIAALEEAAGRAESGVATLRTARDRLGDRRIILEPLGETLQEIGEYAEAYDVFQALEEVVPDDPDVRAMVNSARELYFTTSLPEPYLELENKAELWREDLAALIALRLPDLGTRVEDPRTGVIIVDIEESWARDYIRTVVEWGVMQVFENNAFGPDLVVKRTFLAEVMYRALEVLGAVDGAPRARLSDVATQHYYYEQIQVVVGLGILELDARGSFGLLDPVSGEEAVAAVQRLVRLARGQNDR